jgi:hypothetical protein
MIAFFCVYLQKGGLSDGNQNNSSPALTAFTLISLLEASESDGQDQTDSLASTINRSDGATNDQQQTLVIGNELLYKTLSCLSLAKDDGGAVMTPDPYTTALTAYALVLANRTDDARKKIDWMMNHAQRNNSLIWWQKTGLFVSFLFIIFKKKYIFQI